MGYIELYIETTKTGADSGTMKEYELPGLADTPSAGSGIVDSFKREYNQALNQYRQIQEELKLKKQNMFYTAEDRKKQLLSLESHMQKMLVKIGSYSAEELQEGFNVD
jgi:hypothetical protein